LNRNSKAKVNLGKDPFAHSQERQGFFALQCKLSENEMKDLAKIFNRFKSLGESSQDSIDDVIQGDGSLKLQEELGAVEDDDPLMMIVSWKLNCEVTWEFSRGEFMDGLMVIGCHTIRQIKEKCEEWKREVEMNEESFKNFYTFVFGYLKTEPQAKVLLVETAETVWDMLLKRRKWGLYDQWIKFLKVKQQKAISRDVWQQLLEFIDAYPKNLDKYDETAAWPLLFDEFVEWVKGGDGEGDSGDRDAY